MWSSDLGRETAFGYLNATSLVPHHLNPELVLNEEGSSMLRTLRRELAQSERFFFSVAFVTSRAVALLKQELIDHSGSGVIVTSDYLAFNAPEAFRELLALQQIGIETRIHRSPAFHAKGYIFRRADRTVAVIGSANLTAQALVKNHEWNIKVSGSPHSHLAKQLDDLEIEQLSASLPLTAAWIDEYARRPRPQLAAASPSRPIPEDLLPHLDVVTQSPDMTPLVPGDRLIEPNEMQRDAIEALERLRLSGARKALVVSATGTGKTILAALHVRQASPEKFLFVVHREQILDRAIEEFRTVLGIQPDEIGKIAGGEKQTERKYVFATIQSLSQDSVLGQLSSNQFDYVLIDEAHRASATSYGAVLSHLAPDFLLGLTATPERPDQSDVFGIFDYNVAYEIRLQGALEADMLSPFHYFGVADVQFDDGTSTDEATGIAKLTSRLRVDHIVRQLHLYAQAGIPPKGLIFCSRNDEARDLAIALNSATLHGKPLRTVALSGSDPVAYRQQVVRQLEQGDIHYILTVDIFNEGVDIPAVNQVVMLRQTQSAIVFVQQLGRGLRKSPQKDYTVVIDFIGNYANNYLIPIALFGDNSLNRESIRGSLIAAEEEGAFANISSIRFDRVAERRVLESLSRVRLSSLSSLKPALQAMMARLGRRPRLVDFAEAGGTDPVVLATARRTFPELLQAALVLENPHNEDQLRCLDFIAREVLAAKRPAEGVVLRAVIEKSSIDVQELLLVAQQEDPRLTGAAVESALRVLSLDFHTESERVRYGAGPLSVDSGTARLAPWFSRALFESSAFSDEVNDLLRVEQIITKQRYSDAHPFAGGRQYSRKDACRLLNWHKNVTSTIYGYKVDRLTESCPIFVTYHKASDITSSTQYEDELLDTRTMTWFTRSRRTLQSTEVQAITSNSVALHVFAKKDDNDGSDFFYLGRARAGESFQTTMPVDDGHVSVVRVTLHFDVPIQQGVFDYFQPSLSHQG